MPTLLLVIAASLSQLLARFDTAAARKDFPEAERLAQEAVHRFPESREAHLALARVYLWTGRYEQARVEFGRLTQRNAEDAEAHLGSAQTEYWSGDYRNALRKFQRVLELRPGEPTALRSLEEIRSAMRPGYTSAVEAGTDNQPLRGLGGAASVYWFGDPLTKVTATVRRHHLEGKTLERDVTSAAAVADSMLPQLKLRAAGGITVVRYPDGHSDVAPYATLSRSGLSISVERRPLVQSERGLRTHPSAEVLGLQFRRGWGGWESLLDAEHLRYFDHNRGIRLDGYVLSPSIRHVRWGLSASYRDTRDSRFDGAAYDPYHTPQSLVEGRAVVSWERGRIGIHLDGGRGRDRIAGTFNPWRLRARAAIPMGAAILALEGERAVTAFYRADAFRASVAGRF
ncbi:MAG TPA: tetratricopeptide repeat protein [Thermoanaerobaculia bacterium]|nr:tetratricopeptide repeat protein [Thermoanaerobaculia bacterium]